MNELDPLLDEIDAIYTPGVTRSRVVQEREARFDQIAQELAHLRAIVTGKRRMRRDQSGRGQILEILDDEGNVIATQRITRGADGRIEGTG